MDIRPRKKILPLLPLSRAVFHFEHQPTILQKPKRNQPFLAALRTKEVALLTVASSKPTPPHRNQPPPPPPFTSQFPNPLPLRKKMPSSPTPSERDASDAAARAKEAAEQALLPYKWTQTISDVDITVPVAGNLRGRDIVVELSKTYLKVGVKGQKDLIIDVGFPFPLPSFFLPHLQPSSPWWV